TVNGLEQLLRDGVVVGRAGAGEQVVGQVEIGQVLHDDPVVAIGQLARRDALGLGLHQDRCAVFVCSADHQHVVAGHAHVPAEDVRGDTESGDVPDVAGAVCVWPGDRGQY